MADKALIPVTPSLKMKMEAHPESKVPVSMTIGPSITGASKTTLIEDVKSMATDFTRAGSIINFKIKGNRIQDLPMPEGVQYDTPTRACTQQVMRMLNPETGETTTATNGCQINDLKEAGWVPATGRDPISDPVNGGSGGNGGNGGGGQQAGFSGTDMAVALGGIVVIGGLAWASSS